MQIHFVLVWITLNIIRVCKNKPCSKIQSSNSERSTLRFDAWKPVFAKEIWESTVHIWYESLSKAVRHKQVISDAGIVHSHAPSIRSHRGTKMVVPDFQSRRVSEEPVCIYLFRQNPVFTSLHLRFAVHVLTPLNFNKRDKCRLVLLKLSLAGNL